jgi:hypothetical protein
LPGLSISSFSRHFYFSFSFPSGAACCPSCQPNVNESLGVETVIGAWCWGDKGVAKWEGSHIGAAVSKIVKNLFAAAHPALLIDNSKTQTIVI